MQLRLNDARIYCEWDGFSSRVLTSGCTHTIVRPDTPACGEIAIWQYGQEDATAKLKDRWSLCEKCSRFNDFKFLRRRVPINSNPEIAERIEEILNLVKLERRYQRRRSELTEPQQVNWFLLRRKIIYHYVTRDIRFAEHLADNEEQAIRDAHRNKFLTNIIQMYAKAQTDSNEKILDGLARQTSKRKPRKSK